MSHSVYPAAAFFLFFLWTVFSPVFDGTLLQLLAGMRHIQMFAFCCTSCRVFPPPFSLRNPLVWWNTFCLLVKDACSLVQSQQLCYCTFASFWWRTSFCRQMMHLCLQKHTRVFYLWLWKPAPLLFWVSWIYSIVSVTSLRYFDIIMYPVILQKALYLKPWIPPYLLAIFLNFLWIYLMWTQGLAESKIIEKPLGKSPKCLNDFHCFQAERGCCSGISEPGSPVFVWNSSLWVHFNEITPSWALQCDQ